jgi:glycosyltransferase involved in cell wall biosynthesis
VVPQHNKFTKIEFNSSFFLDVVNLKKLYVLLRHLNSNILFVNMYKSQIWSAITRPRRSKLIWIEQNTYVDRSFLQWHLMKILSWRVNKIVCISEEVKELTIKKLKVSDKVKLIPNPVSQTNTLSRFKNRNKDFIFIGRLVPQKNPYLMLRSFASYILNFEHNSFLHIVGNGVLLGSLKALAKSLKIENNCTFYGWLPNLEVQKMLPGVSTLVSTSHIEGMALVRFEALAAGCCLVTTITGGAKSNLIGRHRIGILTSDPNVHSISLEMHKSLDPKFWTKDKINSRVALARQFEPSVVAQKLIKV